MVFGGDHTSVVNSTISQFECVAPNLEGPPSDLKNIDNMYRFDELVFTMYRLTLVDEYALAVSYYSSLTGITGILREQGQNFILYINKPSMMLFLDHCKQSYRG